MTTTTCTSCISPNLHIVIRVCPLCHRGTHIGMTHDEYTRWQAGEYTQDVFPTWTAEERETLISGTHPACWASMFPTE
jgi:hypothetical protein